MACRAWPENEQRRWLKRVDTYVPYTVFQRVAQVDESGKYLGSIIISQSYKHEIWVSLCARTSLFVHQAIASQKCSQDQ